VKMAKKCVKRNSVGDCIEWSIEKDELVGDFNEEDKKCNPKLFEEFKQKFRDRKIKIRLED